MEPRPDRAVTAAGSPPPIAGAGAEAARSPSMELFNSWIDVARPWVRAVDGDLPGAVAAALDGPARAQDAGLVGFEVVSLHDAVRLGAADDVVVPLRAAARSAEGPFAPVCADHARAAAARDSGGLASAAERFASLGLHLLASEAAAQAAAALRASGSARAARAMASRASSLQIAEELVTWVRTVDNHLHRVYAKLGVEDRDQLRSVLGSDR